MQNAACAQERAHLQTSCKSLTQENCSLKTLLLDAQHKIKDMHQTYVTCLGDSAETYGAELPHGKISQPGSNTAVLGYVSLQLVCGQHPVDDVM